jgi:phosphoribosylformylglycinamidine (FGAM) synthase-like amidotransferase family enzyme
MGNIVDEIKAGQEFTREIYGICNEKSNYKMQNEFFAKWWWKAFPDNKDLKYVSQWVDRFLAGTPSVFMDRIRTKAYIEVVKEWNGMENEDI